MAIAPSPLHPVQDASAVTEFQLQQPERAQHFSVLLKEADTVSDADAQVTLGHTSCRRLFAPEPLLFLQAAKRAKCKTQGNARAVLEFDHSNVLKNDGNTG